MNFQVNWTSTSDSDVDHEDDTTLGTINHVETVDDIILPLAMLNVDGGNLGKDVTSSDLTKEQVSIVSPEASHRFPALLSEKNDNYCAPWRSVLSKIEVWYACYGSNMWKDRFLCYIVGGKVCSYILTVYFL